MESGTQTVAQQEFLDSLNITRMRMTKLVPEAIMELVRCYCKADCYIDVLADP